MGFEPTTSAVTGRRSNQLSHQAITFLSAHQSMFSIRFFFYPILSMTFSQEPLPGFACFLLTFLVKPSTD